MCVELKFNVRPIASLLGVSENTLYRALAIEDATKVRLTPERQRILAIKEILNRKEAEAMAEVKAYIQKTS